MSEWKVALTFSEGASNKFWRARTEGSTLYVNFGRIGSDGQTQIKELASEDAADKELAKLEREKRKKGYEDEGAAAAGAGDEEEDVEEEEEEEEVKAKPAPAPKKVGAAAIVPSASKTAATAAEHADFSLEVEGRKIDLRLTFDGSTVRTTVVERYGDTATAKDAFGRLKEQMVADGYKKVARDTL